MEPDQPTRKEDSTAPKSVFGTQFLFNPPQFGSTTSIFTGTGTETKPFAVSESQFKFGAPSGQQQSDKPTAQPLPLSRAQPGTSVFSIETKQTAVSTGSVFGQKGPAAAVSQPSGQSVFGVKPFELRRPAPFAISNESRSQAFTAPSAGPSTGPSSRPSSRPSSSGPAFTRRTMASGRLEPKTMMRSPPKSPKRVNFAQSTAEFADSPPLEDTSDKLSIICTGIPTHLNNAVFIKRHFSKFGDVVSVKPNLKNARAVVTFKTHEQAASAKKNGAKSRELSSPMKIFFKKTNDRRRSSEDTSEAPFVPPLPMAPPPQPLQPPPPPPPSSSQQAFQFERARPAPILHSGAANPLDVLRNQEAKTSEEKFQILDKRDKILRQAHKRVTDVAKARAVIGTCADMCPEKERYEREYQRRLSSLFEVLPGTSEVDHARAIKEYSRSSADQEEPLPHEMRPPEVLDRTMTFILADRVNRAGDNLADCYSFIWNRMRALRKEITQQHLRDSVSVAIHEKCVRFHIYCAEKLSEQDMATFSQKLNDESISKCLKSLFDYYEDGHFLQNEPEFRAYYILLHLNESDVLRETQQFRSEVLSSPLVKFALRVYSALNENNYARFFKLVRQTTFLSACVLHRYFSQVRQTGLTQICRAFKPSFPLEKATGLLGFENINEARLFCEHYGIHVEDDQIIIDKSQDGGSDSKFPATRAITLIESLQDRPLGEIINGAPLPPIQLFAPENSFDSRGRFIGHMPESVAHLPEPVLVPVLPPQAPARMTISMLLENLSQQEVKQLYISTVKSTTRTLIIDVIDEQLRGVAGEVKRSVDRFFLAGERVLAELVEAETRRLSAFVAHECIEEARHIQSSKEYAAQSIRDQLVDDVTATLGLDVSRGVITEMRQIHARKQKIGDEVHRDLMEALIRDESRLIVDASIVEFELHLEELERRCVIVQQRRTKRFWKYWIQRFAHRMEQKEQIKRFPAGLIGAWKQRNAGLEVPAPNKKPKMGGWKLTDFWDDELDQTELLLDELVERNRESVAFTDLVGCLHDFVRQGRVSGEADTLFWKIVVVTSDAAFARAVASRLVCQQQLDLVCIASALFRSLRGKLCNVQLCARVVPAEDVDQEVFHGAHGCFFLDVEEGEFVEEMPTTIPFATILPTPSDDEGESPRNLFVSPRFELGDALRWMLPHMPQHPLPKLRFLQDVCYKFISKHFFERVLTYRYTKMNIAATCLVELYNSCVQFLDDLVLSQIDVSWPQEFEYGVPKYDWDSSESKQQIQRMFYSLQLPPLKELIDDYVRDVSDHSGISMSVLSTRLINCAKSPEDVIVLLAEALLEYCSFSVVLDNQAVAAVVSLHEEDLEMFLPQKMVAEERFSADYEIEQARPDSLDLSDTYEEEKENEVNTSLRDLQKSIQTEKAAFETLRKEFENAVKSGQLQ